mgnify:CR=1 FL=1
MLAATRLIALHKNKGMTVAACLKNRTDYIENPDKTEQGQFVSLVALDMDAYAAKYGSNAVKKTLTIPAWLNTFVEQNGISCSKVLQEALGKMAQARQ